MKDLQIDTLQRERCWSCGGKSFEPITPHGPLALHRSSTSLVHQPNVQCTRCGAHNKVGTAGRYQGPADPTYAQEWRDEQSRPEEHAPEEQDLRPEDPPELSPLESLGRGALTGLLASELAEGMPPL